jgi:osmotically-inducible protein OsmY
MKIMRTKNSTKTEQRLIVGAIALCLALTSASIASAKEVGDADITSAINSEMWVDLAVSANNVDVTTKDGVVTLKGTVNNILAKDRALALAEATVGVRAVVNMVEVKPTTPRDDKELAKAVKDAWLTDPAADSYELSASARNGVVTLTGTVQSYTEKDLSAIVAKGVRGVKGIKNEIKVDYKTKRSDLEIKTEVEERLVNDIRVDDYLVKVKVKGGDVTLSGTVGSLQEKTRASHDTWVVGMKSVDIDGLEVKWWARDKMMRTSSYISRTDEEIKKAVKDAFLDDPRVLSFNPEVEVSSGTVTMSGIVGNLRAKRAAEQDARNTLGVWRVKNHLKVRPTIPTNTELENRVAMALLDNPYVERYKIYIDAHTGRVYLSGNVHTSFEKNQAERVTEGVKGVTGIANNLKHDTRWVWKPDWEIRQNVKDQLWWSPFVEADDINIAVDDGVVTLSGTVDSWSERDDAEKNAFQGGAKDVNNNLAVDYRYYGPYGPGYYGSHYYHGPYYEPYQ